MKKDIIAIIILILLVVVSAYFIGTKEKEKYTGGFNTYIVMTGDTLWSIACDTQSHKDIREVIHIIKKDNSMSKSVIYAGQELKLRDEY